MRRKQNLIISIKKNMRFLIFCLPGLSIHCIRNERLGTYNNLTVIRVYYEIKNNYKTKRNNMKNYLL